MTETVGPRGRATDLIDRIRRASAEGDVAGAGDAALAARHLWGASARTAFVAGKALARADRAPDAVAAFRIATTLDPDKPAWWAGLIVALRSAEPSRDDVDRIGDAASRYPDNAMLQATAARFLSQAKHRDASRVLARALMLAPEDRALHRFAENAARRGGDAVTTEDALRGHAALTDDAPVHLRFARALVANGKLAEAADILAAIPARADLTEQTLVASLLDQADVSIRLGRKAEAAQVFERLVTLQPSAIDHHLKAIALLDQTGDRDAAKALRPRAIALTRETLRDGFDTELARIDATDEGHSPPASILDRLWATSPHKTIERSEWERRIRNGRRRLLLVKSATLAQPDSPDVLTDRTTIDGIALLQNLRREGRGTLVASAHVGPVRAAIASLYRIDPTMRWVTAAPAWYPEGFLGAMISAFAVAPRAVTAQVFSALRDGRLVMMAPDVSQPKTTGVRSFFGGVVPDVRYAASVLALAGAESVFAQTRWEGHDIKVLLHEMPSRADFDDEPAFAEAWADRYYRLVLRQFEDEPENLLCGGGFWAKLR